MSPENIKPATSVNDDAINLVAFTKVVWSDRRTIIFTTIIFGMLGFFIAIFTSREFIATTIMVPSATEGASKLGGLGGLAAMAGINLNSVTASELSPTVYPQIVSSLPYQLELMKTPLDMQGLNKPVTFQEYYTDIKKPNLFLKYTIGLPGEILLAIKGRKSQNIINSEEKVPLQLTDKERDVRKILSGLISLEVNPKEGLLTLSASMPEPLAAAQLGQRAQELLQRYITEFKIKKAKANLDFIQQRYDETAREFDMAQQRLATFNDRNKNVSLATAKTEQERLLRQYNLIYGIYTELAKQLEQAKIQVKQDTPVFTIIEPISVPTERSKPNRTLILIIWTFLGGLIGLGIVFGRVYIASVRKQWNEK